MCACAGGSKGPGYASRRAPHSVPSWPLLRPNTISGRGGETGVPTDPACSRGGATEAGEGMGMGTGAAAAAGGAGLALGSSIGGLNACCPGGRKTAPWGCGPMNCGAPATGEGRAQQRAGVSALSQPGRGKGLSAGSCSASQPKVAGREPAGPRISGGAAAPLTVGEGSIGRKCKGRAAVLQVLHGEGSGGPVGGGRRPQLAHLQLRVVELARVAKAAAAAAQGGEAG